MWVGNGTLKHTKKRTTWKLNDVQMMHMIDSNLFSINIELSGVETKSILFSRSSDHRMRTSSIFVRLQIYQAADVRFVVSPVVSIDQRCVFIIFRIKNSIFREREICKRNCSYDSHIRCQLSPVSTVSLSLLIR